jgi:hypothetical protein
MLPKKPTARDKRLAATRKARVRVLQQARRVGTITNAQARKLGHWNQAWYHLNKMVQHGYLRRAGYNVWEAVRRPGRPSFDL